MRVSRMYFLVMTEVPYFSDDELQTTLAMYSSKREAEYYARMLNEKYDYFFPDLDTIHFSVDTSPVEHETARFISIPNQFKHEDLLGCYIEAHSWSARVTNTYRTCVLAVAEGFTEYIEFTDIEGVFRYED